MINLLIFLMKYFFNPSHLTNMREILPGDYIALSTVISFWGWEGLFQSHSKWVILKVWFRYFGHKHTNLNVIKLRR